MRLNLEYSLSLSPMRSMTAFAKETFMLRGSGFTIEIKSVNAKQLDLQLKIDSVLLEKEYQMRKIFAASVARGRVEVCIGASKNIKSSSLFSPALDEFIARIKKIEAKNNLPPSNYLELFLHHQEPETRWELSEEEWSIVHNAIKKTIKSFEQESIHEGKILAQSIHKNLKIIKMHTKKIAEQEAERTLALKNALHKKIQQELAEHFDENRLLQELCYMMDKIDITEERVRLEKHRIYFEETMEQWEEENGNGKKLQFIAQEMLREMNTMGAKASFAPLQKNVMSMKNELEKIKEQLGNVY